ncbi:MAG: patatin-like phospholipase family protein [Clostridia bacterium]
MKGAAHIGALKAFEEENIEFDYVSGASSGSIVAALYASGYKADEIYKLFKQYAKK